MNSEARLFTVYGRVQGVWFRDSTRREAERLLITGHAINLPDGNVEVLACGSTAALASWRSGCTRDHQWHGSQKWNPSPSTINHEPASRSARCEIHRYDPGGRGQATEHASRVPSSPRSSFRLPARLWIRLPVPAHLSHGTELGSRTRDVLDRVQRTTCPNP